MATENRLDLKNESSSSGCFVCRSHITKVKAITTAPAIATMIVGEAQPRTGASMIPHSNRATPRSEHPAPTTSGRWAFALSELGTITSAATQAAAAMGTLIKNTEPHQ